VGKRSDHHRSRICLFFSDCSRFAPERKERRLGRGFWRSGQPDGIWPTGRGFGSFPGHNLVRNHLHAHVDHAFDFCSAPNRAHVRTFGSEAVADQVAARDTGHAIRSAHRSAEPGATKIKVLGLRSQVSGPASRSSVQSLHNSTCTILFFLRPNTCDLRPCFLFFLRPIT